MVVLLTVRLVLAIWTSPWVHLPAHPTPAAVAELVTEPATEPAAQKPVGIPKPATQPATQPVAQFPANEKGTLHIRLHPYGMSVRMRFLRIFMIS